MKRFVPFILAIAGTALALGLSFLVFRTDLLPIRLPSAFDREEATE